MLRISPRALWPIAAFLMLASGCDRGTRPEVLGKVAPDFTIQDSGRAVSLHDFRGKVVVLNFWATWCPPCIEEMPALVAMQQNLSGRITVLAISVDDDLIAYRSFLQQHNITLQTVRDPGKRSARLYGTFKYPETYVIDSHGVIRRKFVGPVQWTNPEIMAYLQTL